MNTEIIDRLERSFEKEDALERDRQLIQETVEATLLEWDEDLEHLRNAGVLLRPPQIRAIARALGCSYADLMSLIPSVKQTSDGNEEKKTGTEREVMRGNISRRGKRSWRIKFDLGTDPGHRQASDAVSHRQRHQGRRAD